MSRRVKPVQDQKMKRRRAVIVGSSSDNGQSRTVLERPQGVVRSHSSILRGKHYDSFST
jgi:hypothetical protein